MAPQLRHFKAAPGDPDAARSLSQLQLPFIGFFGRAGIRMNPQMDVSFELGDSTKSRLIILSTPHLIESIMAATLLPENGFRAGG